MKLIYVKSCCCYVLIYIGNHKTSTHYLILSKCNDGWSFLFLCHSTMECISARKVSDLGFSPDEHLARRDA